MADEEASSCNTHTGLYLGLGIGLLGNHSQEQNRSKKACPSSTSLVSLGLSFTPPPYDEDMQVMNGVDQQHHRSDGPDNNEDDENGNNNNNNAIKNGKKKLRLTKDQSSLLEETFKLHPTLTPAQKQSLAEQLNLKHRQVEVWFQNRRARSKLKQTEIDCEFLKKCCEGLSNENRRLKMEIQELRTLSQNKTTTEVSLCPSCEKNYYG